MNTLFLLLMAIIPGFIISVYIYIKDSDTPEPLNVILMSVFFGVISFFLAIGIGMLLENFTHIEHEDVAHQMIKALVFVGLVEEGSKFLFLRGFLFNNRSFRQPFDGIVYSVMIGMGFATAENIIYVFNGGGGTAIVRMFTAVPAHAFFAVIMGFFIGEAKVFKMSSGLYSFLALFFATFAHGYYDYFIFLSFIPGLWSVAFVSLIIVIIVSHIAFKLRKDEIIDHDYL